MSGREVLPLVEGGKGISVSNGESSGAWASAGGIGTFSGVNADARYSGLRAKRCLPAEFHRILPTTDLPKAHIAIAAPSRAALDSAL